MSTKLRKTLDKSKKAAIYDEIEILNKAYADTLLLYSKIVLPYGFGYNMPKDVSVKATAVSDEAALIKKRLIKLQKEVGIIVEKTKIESNARFVAMADSEESLIKKLIDDGRAVIR